MSDPTIIDAESGMVFGIPWEEYQGWPGLHKSHLWTMNERTPAHYRWQEDHPEEEEDSEALEEGRRVHERILEPATFDAKHIMEPAPPSGDHWDRRGKEHKAAWSRFLAEHGGQDILWVDDCARYNEMTRQLLNHPSAKLLLAGSQVEASMRWVDPGTGLNLKGRLDGWCSTGSIFWDLKTCRNAAPGPFGRDAYRYGYPFQMAMYFDGLTQINGEPPGLPMLVAVEKTPPYLVAVYEVGEQALELGRHQYQSILRQVAECKKKDRWPGYSDNPMDLILPYYAGLEMQSSEQGD